LREIISHFRSGTKREKKKIDILLCFRHYGKFAIFIVSTLLLDERDASEVSAFVFECLSSQANILPSYGQFSLEQDWSSVIGGF